ncbi:hypothetical protein HDU91_003334 [Kappamyces sp. JEL0680]|nr:hypothetical protein HDU91_003334 [Kappamyces sp. JEL0680]
MSSYVIANILDKAGPGPLIYILGLSMAPSDWQLKNLDSDYRVMACIDLFHELEKPSFLFENSSETKVVDALLAALSDSNSEVQNNALKW